MKRKKDTYKETRVFESSKAIIRVHFPDIDEEENSRRMEEFRKAAEDLLRALVRDKKI